MDDGAPAAVIPTGATGLLTIDLTRIRSNWRALARHVAPAECAAVVKADAYGLGAARIVPALAQAGCRTFFVATLEEAAQARALLPDAAIYVLNGLPHGAAREMAALRAVPVLAELEDVGAWASLARDGAASPPAALHIDTGLNRLGMSASDVGALARDKDLLRRLDIALVMSHLACADEAAHPMNAEQLACFNRLRAMLPPARASLAASDGLMLGKAYHLDLVRPGYALYGGQATPQRTTPVAPVVRARARILQVREVAQGEHIGYSGSYLMPAQRRIATIAAGYADGVLRHASATNAAPGGAVAIGGTLAPIVGRVSMDLITVDVTDVDPAPRRGDLVDIIGPDLTLEAVGAAAGSIGYEVLTRVGARFHRSYRDHGD